MLRLPGRGASGLVSLDAAVPRKDARTLRAFTDILVLPSKLPKVSGKVTGGKTRRTKGYLAETGRKIRTMADTTTSATKGGARCPGTSWEDLMAADSRPSPDFLKQESYTYRGSDPIPADRYTSEEWAKLERERMWPYVWQFAARDEDLPEPGDYVEIGRAHV